MGASAEIEATNTFDLGWRSKVAAGLVGPLAALSIWAPPKADAYNKSEYICDGKGAAFAAPVKYELARACARLESSGGTVVLVDFTPDANQARVVADQTEKELADGSDNLVRPTIIPTVASPGAMAKFNMQNPYCVNLDDITAVGAFIADTKMDITADHIIAVSDKPGCADASTGKPDLRKEGMSWNAQEWRYAQVVQANMLQRKLEPNYIGKIAAHEILHQYGFGHAGFVSLPDHGPILNLDNNQVHLFNLSAKEHIDITNLLKSPWAAYEQYGSAGNIMGLKYTAGGYDTLRLNAMQRWRLKWPERTLASEHDSLVPIKKNGEGILMPNNTADADFAAVPLEHPIELKDIQGTRVTFTSLVIEQYSDDTGATPGVYELNFVTPMNSTLTTASLGLLDLREPGKSHRMLRFNGQNIDITMTPQATTVSSRVD